MKSHSCYQALYVAICLFFAPGLFAQEAEKKSDKKSIETITVHNNYSLYYLRKEMEKAELDFYDAFNKLTDIEDYKIKCANQAATGTLRKTKVCQPQYVLNAFAKETQDAWSLATINVPLGALPQGATFPSQREIEFSVRETREEALAYTEELVKKHPELLEKLILLNQKQEDYQRHKDAK